MNKLNVTNLEQENHRKGVKAVRVSSGDSWCVRVVLPRLKIIDQDQVFGLEACRWEHS